MGTRCQACHGILGQDCFNEHDCMQISRNNEQYEHEQRYEQEFEHFDIINFTTLDLVKEILKRIKSETQIIKNAKKNKKEWEERGIKIEDIPF